MGETGPFKRRCRVTLLRLAVVAAVVSVAAWTFFAGSAAEMERMQDPHAFTYGRAVATLTGTSYGRGQSKPATTSYAGRRPPGPPHRAYIS